MVRKAHGARERFGEAAMELFRIHGYTDVTVPQIAAVTGLTDRTYYRYFADKAEVLFWRADDLQAEIVQSISQSDVETPLDLVIGALESAGRFFDENRQDVVTRQAIVGSQTDLQERELMKMHTLVVAIRSGLEMRGISASIARIVAEMAVLIWRIAIDRWVAAPTSLKFSRYVRDCLAETRSIIES